MLGPNQLLSINTHSGLNVLGLCCCPKPDPGGALHTGGASFEPVAPRRKRVNPYLRVRARRRAHGAIELPLRHPDGGSAASVEMQLSAEMAVSERYIPSAMDYGLARYFQPDHALAIQSSSNLLEVMPQLPAVSDEAALLALIALGIWDADDCC